MFKGRVGRLGFLLGIVYVVAPMVLAIALTYVLALIFGSSQNVVTRVVSLLVLVFSLVWAVWYFVEAFSLLIRRWHDLNQSGFLSLLSLVPGVNFIILILLLVLAGTKGQNQYGDTASGVGFKSVMFPQSGPANTQPANATTPDLPPKQETQASQPDVDPGPTPDLNLG